MSELIYRVNESVAIITINRPKRRNALSGNVINLFHDAIDSAASDAEVRVVVITGAGEKSFCAGADLGGGVGKGGTERYASLLKKITHFPKPTIAKVRGYCLAGGMGVMLAADIVVASETAQFGTPEVNVGLWPSMISAFIYRNMLPKQALAMILMGDRFGSEKAKQMGFLTEIVPNDKLDGVVADMAQKLSEKSPIGMKLGKASYLGMQNMALEDALDYLSQELTKVAMTKDAAEGIQAFMEKRKPNFTGE